MAILSCFPLGRGLQSLSGAYTAASAYAAATEGMVLDCEQGKSLTSQEAAQAARDIEKQLPAMAQALQNATEKLKR